MNSIPIRRPIQRKRNLQLGLQHLEAALNVGLALEPGHNFDGLEVSCVRDRQQFAVHHLRRGHSLNVDVEGEHVGSHIELMKLDR